MNWVLAINATTFLSVISTRGSAGTYCCLWMCKLIADCHLIWTLDNSWFIVLFFSDAHLCIIARRKEALDSGIRLFQAIVCDLLICKGIFNFLFVPKEIKFLDVVQFMCRWKRKSQNSLQCQQACIGQIPPFLHECY